MFFALGKLTALLQSPIIWVLFLLVWGFLKKKKKVQVTGMAILAILSNEWIVGQVFWHWEQRPKKLAEVPVCEVAIVCGGFSDILMEPRDRVYLNRAADRFMQAVWLFKKGKVKRILVTGGNPYLASDLQGEALRVKELAKLCSLPDSVFLVENKSRSTYENALYSSQVCDSLNISKTSVILVTSAFHINRAQATFSKAGFSPFSFAVDFRAGPVPPPLYKIFFFSSEPVILADVWAHEVIGLLAYKLMGYSE